MPRYFFNVVDGQTIKDHVGVELVSDEQARMEAARAADLTRHMFKGNSFRVVVTDENGKVVVELVVCNGTVSPR